MRRKGSYIVPLTLLVFVSGPMMVGVTLLVPGMADSVLQLSGHDTRNAPLAKSTATYLRQHYIPDAVNWSVYQTTYELGQAGGGETWSENGIPPESTIRGNWEEKAAADFQERYLTGEFPEDRTRCRIAFPAPSITVDSPLGERNGVGGVVHTLDADPMKVQCATATANTTVFVDIPPDRFSAGNRYFLLYQEMADELPNLFDGFDELAGETFSASVSSCESGGDARRRARTRAGDAARSAIRAEFTPFEDFPSNGLQVTRQEIDPRADVRITDTEIIEDDCSETICVGEGESETCTTTYWDKVRATAEAEPAGGTVTLGIEDARYSTPTQSGERPLEFSVEEASFSIG